MTLKTLCKEVNVQGNIRLSIWDELGEEEIEVHEFCYVDGLASHINTLPNGKQLNRMNVHFMFAPGDGFLHIELKPIERR